MPVDYLQKILTAKVYDVAVETPLELRADSVAAARQSRAAEARGPAAGVLVQAARRLQQDGAPARGRARARRHRRVGRQPRAGRCARRAAARLRCDDRHAGHDAAHQDRRGRERAARKSFCTAIRTRMPTRRRASCRAETGATFVHPYDDPDVIAGQGTIGMEILRQCHGPLDAIFVAVGGGGLISGIASYVKRVRPDVKIIGVQPEDSDAMARSLAAGRRVRLPHVGLFADGVAVKQVGTRDVSPRARVVDEMVLVDTDAICAALKDVFEDTRSILEPAGALAIAGVKAWVARHAGQGSDVRRDRLRREHELRPAALRRRARRARRAARGDARGDDSRAARAASATFCALLGKRSVTEFNYRYADPRVGAPVRRHRSRESARDRAAARARCAASTIEALRPVRQRDGEAARPPPGRRPRAGSRARDPVPVRVSGAPRRADAVPRQHERAAGTSACSTTATTAPTTGACWSACRCRRGQSAEFRRFSRPPRLRLRRRDRPIRRTGCFSAAERQPRRCGGTTCRETAHAGRSKIAGMLRFRRVFEHRSRFRQALCSRSTDLGRGRLGSVRCGAVRPRGDFAPRGPSRRRSWRKPPGTAAQG